MTLNRFRIVPRDLCFRNLNQCSLALTGNFHSTVATKKKKPSRLLRFFNYKDTKRDRREEKERNLSRMERERE